MTPDVAVLERPLGREARVFLASFLGTLPRSCADSLDARLHPAAGLLLQLHPAREFPGHRRRLPSGAVAPAAVCLVSAAAGRRNWRRLFLPPRSRGAVDWQHLFYERHGRAGRRRREHDAPAARVRDRRRALRDAGAAHGQRDGRAAAVARLHDQPRWQPRRRGPVCRDLVAPALANVVVRRRVRRGAAATADGGAWRRPPVGPAKAGHYDSEGSRRRRVRGRQHRAPRS